MAGTTTFHLTKVFKEMPDNLHRSFDEFLPFRIKRIEKNNNTGDLK
jgi:hypothetical protein